MGFGGGGSSGPSREQIEIQRKQTQLEEQRLNLQQEAAARQSQELALLQQQVTEQNRLGAANIAAFQRTTEELGRGQARLSTILDERVNADREQAEQAANENLRARLSANEAQNNSTASVLSQQNRQTNFARKRRLAPQASLLDQR